MSFIPHNVLLEITEKTAILREEERPNGDKIDTNGDKIDTSALQTLTPRELEVFELVRRGKSNKIIAYEIG